MVNSVGNRHATDPRRAAAPTYWRITFDIPLLNIFGPELLPQLDDVISAIETDGELKVVVFDSGIEGFFFNALQFCCSAGGLSKSSCRTIRPAAAPRHARSSQSSSRCVHSIVSWPRDRSWKRAFTCGRHAVCRPQKGYPIAMGGRGWLRSRRGANGAIAPFDGPGSCPRSTS